MKLSIITINYNNKAGLQKTIDSVMSQTWRDFEWIIIDGGSTDGSKEVIESVASDPKSNISYWCSEPDKGIYNAMNKGIAYSNGEYAIFMNSGDRIYQSQTFESLFVEKHVCSDIIVGCAIKEETGEIMEPLSIDAIEKLLLVFTFCHQAAFIRTLLLKHLPYDETLHIVADWKFFLLEILKYNASVQTVNDIIASVESYGISGINIQKRIDERYHVIKELYGRGVADLIQDYNALRWNEILRNTNVLLKNDPFLYRFVRRFLAMIMKFYEFKNKLMSNKR